MLRLVIRLVSDDSGASAAEYALILAIVGGAIVLAALALGVAIGGAVDRAATNIADCGGGC
jgi:pilus assembly protein Flp/PilA